MLRKFVMTSLALSMNLIVLRLACFELRAAETCMKSAWNSGSLDRSEELEAFTIPRGQPAACSCCGLCSSNPACSSFSVFWRTGQCRLYRSVARYDTLIPDRNWKYYVMPGRSGHHQFCRWDADCTEDGEYCRGRVCTTLSVVTCNFIINVLGAEDRYATHFMTLYGWMNNTEVIFRCSVRSETRGSTLILWNKRGGIYTEENIRRSAENAEYFKYSILYQADDLCALSAADACEVIMMSHVHVTRFQTPRSEPVIGSGPRPGVGSISSSHPRMLTRFEVCLPFYMPPGSANLVSIRCDADDSTAEGQIARRDGRFGRWLGGAHHLYLMMLV